MKPDNIEKLLEKFYAGETSLNEENELRAFLNQESLPEPFLAAKEYFAILQDEKELELEDSFDERIWQQIDFKEDSPNMIKMWSYRISGVAAVIILFVMVWFGTDLLQPNEVYGTISDPSLAFVETQKVLEEVSKNMKKGLQPAEKTVKKVDDNIKRVGELKKMNQALESTKSIQKIDKASDLLKSISKVYVSYGDS